MNAFKRKEAPMQGHVKRSFSIPVDVSHNLAVISSQLGISQSAVLTHLIAEPLQDMRVVMDEVHKHAAEGASEYEIQRRMRGRSLAIIDRRVSEVERFLKTGPENEE